MKVCFVVNNLSLGGAERQVSALALEHRRRGNPVDLVTLLPNKALVEELVQAGVHVHELDFKKARPLGTIKKLRGLFDAGAPEVVHSHLFHSNIASRAAIRGSRPLVCTIHSSVETSRFRYALYRATERWCDLTTVVSSQGRQSFIDRTKTHRSEKVRECRNGLDVDAYILEADERTRTRATLGLADEFVWIAIGRHMEAKNYPLLIDSFAEHLKHRPKAILLMVGDGPDRGALEAQTTKLAIGDRVRFLGNRRDIPELFAAADAHVMSSRLEGLPMVLLEACCAGRYSVATDVGSIAQALDGGRLGHLVPSENAATLTEAMNEVSDLTENELREKGEQARQFVRSRYSIEAVVEEWMTIYRELIAAHS